jgi:uncharacterized membrane protein
MKGSFSIDEVFSYGWKTMLKNFGFFVLMIIIVGAVGGTLGGLNGALSASDESAAQGLAFVISLIYFVAVMIMQVGVTKITLQILDGKKTSHAELFTNWEVFGNYVLGSIIYGLIVCGGMILFVVPGIYWSIRYRFFSYLIIDKKMNAWEAIIESSRITRGQRWQVFAFELPKAIVMITGFLALGFGLLLALPTVLMAETAVYRDLLDRAAK